MVQSNSQCFFTHCPGGLVSISALQCHYDVQSDLVKDDRLYVLLVKPRHVFRTLSINFYKLFILVNFLLPYSLTACLMRSVKHSGKLATATALLFWQKCLEFHGGKPFTILNAYLYALFSYSFSFNLFLRWLLLLSMAVIKGHAQAFHIT